MLSANSLSLPLCSSSSSSSSKMLRGVYSDTTQLNSTDPVEQRTTKSVVFLFMTSRPTNWVNWVTTFIDRWQLSWVELCRYKHPFNLWLIFTIIPYYRLYHDCLPTSTPLYEFVPCQPRLVGWLMIYVAVSVQRWLSDDTSGWLLVGVVPDIDLLFYSRHIISIAVSRSILKPRNSTWILCMMITKPYHSSLLCWVTEWVVLW